jgi:siroheme synthase
VPTVLPHPLLTLSIISAVILGAALGVVRGLSQRAYPVSALVGCLSAPAVFAIAGAYLSSGQSAMTIDFVTFALAASAISIVVFFACLTLALLVAALARSQRAGRIARLRKAEQPKPITQHD